MSLYPNPNYQRSYALRILRKLEPTWPLVTWRARYSDTFYAGLSLEDRILTGTISGVDPHDAVTLGITHCAQCWDAATQRARDPKCPTCFGTGWTGGFSAPMGLHMRISDSNFLISNPDTGQNVSLPGVTGMHIANQLILPLDLVVMNKDPRVRYLVGTEVEQAGIEPPMLLRNVGLSPLNPQDFLATNVPMPLVTP